MRPYHYQDFSNPEHIRLVTIRPGRFDDGLLLAFDVFDISSNEQPLYDALSYTWDTQAGRQSVYIADNDEIFELQIPCNLEKTLRYLRFAHKPRAMWIDGLCINQGNNVEKGLQVSRMGQVYRLACRVFIWLGEEEKASTHALNTMLWIGSKVIVDWARVSVTLRPECIEPNFQDVNIGIPLQPGDTEAIYHLLSRRWFDRLWVRQEVMLSEERAVIQCGHHEIPWPPFRRALACIYQKPRPRTPFHDKLNNRLLSLRGLIGQAPKVPLGYARSAFGQSDCADPRDRIYALLEFLPDNEKAMIGFPDYSKEVGAVFRDIAWRHISHYNTLNILSQCQIDSKRATQVSWTPDWTKKDFIYGRNYWRGFASSQLGAVCELGKGGSVLKTPGVSITKIKQLTNTDPMSGFNVEEQVHHTLQMLFPSEGLDERYVTGIKMLEAYAKVSVANAFSEHLEPWLGEDPTLEEVQEIILTAIGLQESDSLQKYRDGHIREVYKVMRGMLADRKLMHGSGGYIGTVPQPTQEGDEVCMLLGCHTALVLRRIRNNTFHIVGECYMPGVMEGEAILGPLPDSIRRIFAVDKKWGVYSQFLNTKSQSIQRTDPRLQSLILETQDFSKSLSNNPNTKLKLKA